MMKSQTTEAAPATVGEIRVSYHGENCILHDDRGWVTGSIRPGAAEEIAHRYNTQPLLLDALRNVLRICEHNCPEDASPAIELARAALARAEKGGAL